MTDYQPITEADLEVGSAAPPPAPTDGGATYAPITEADLAPSGPAGPTGEFAYKGIPAAAAARFKASNPLTNIFGAAVTKAVNGYANAFQSMTAADQQTLIENGYGNYKQGFPGSLLQHAADMFNSGLTLTVDGFLALGPAFSEGVAGIEGQIARETGAPDDVAQSAEREGGFIGQAVQSDVGAMHGAAMLDAAKANAAVPGVYGHAYRFDVTPEGSAVSTPLGRLPADGAEAQHQAEVAANALHLPPETATLIHQTYLDTGRPPAEVFMDAQTNHGGVLDDLVAGKVPYGGKAVGTPSVPISAPGIPDLEKIPGTIEQAEKLPLAGENLGGLTVTGNVPNTSSIAASLGDDYSEVDGIRAIPISEFPGAGKGYVSASDMAQVNDLADQIKTNGYIDPLIVVMDKDGPYVLEGSHRLDALKQLGHKDVPAMVIVDHGNEHPAATAAYAVIEKQRAADQAAFLKEKGMTQAEASALPAPAKKELNTAFQKWRADKAIAPKPPVAPTAEQGLSKIGLSIEQKAIDQGVTDGFLQTAGYDVKTVKGQTDMVADLVANSPDKMNAIVNGNQPLPHGMDPSMFIAGVESYIEKTKDWDLAARLANSPVVTKTSEAAQTLRFAQERVPDSASAALAELQQAKVKQAGGAAEVVKKQRQVKAALGEGNGIFLPKEEMRWDRFLSEIAC